MTDSTGELKAEVHSEYLGDEQRAINHRGDKEVQAEWIYLCKRAPGGWWSAVFRLDYLSCCLTVLSTVLVGRKRWTGLAVAGLNSLIICVIGFRTGQLGFIPANLFCIGVYAFSIRSWVRAGS